MRNGKTRVLTSQPVSQPISQSTEQKASKTTSQRMQFAFQNSFCCCDQLDNFPRIKIPNWLTGEWTKEIDGECARQRESEHLIE